MNTATYALILSLFFCTFMDGSKISALEKKVAALEAALLRIEKGTTP